MQQLALALERSKLRKRRRAQTGPKPHPDRKGFMPHRSRPAHDARHPVHVTIRRVRLAPRFRTERVRTVILRELARAKSNDVRVVQYSIQDDHLHFMIEGNDSTDLSTQMRKLFSRIAMMVNAASGRRGSLFRDRHHRHALATPRQVRNALVYILFNARKHQRDHASEAQALHDAPDSFSSAPWFTAWASEARPPPGAIAASRRGLPADAPVAPAATWLASVGWKRGGGPLRFDEAPRRP